jgi:hypothetical protein
MALADSIRLWGGLVALQVAKINNFLGTTGSRETSGKQMIGQNCCRKECG